MRTLYKMAAALIFGFASAAFVLLAGPHLSLMPLAFGCVLLLILSAATAGLAGGFASTFATLFAATGQSWLAEFDRQHYLAFCLLGFLLSIWGELAHTLYARLKRKKAEEIGQARAFRDAENRFHSALTASHAGIYRLDLKRGTAFRSASLNKIFGLEDREGTYSISDFMKRIHIEDQPRVNRSIQRMMFEKSSFSERYRVYRADGSAIWIKDRGMVLLDENGEMSAITGTMVDISDLVQAEENAQRSQEQFRILVEGIKDYGIFLADENGSIVSWNRGAERITGFSDDEAIGQSISAVLPGVQLNDRDCQHPAIRNPVQSERWHKRKSGEAFLGQESTYPLYKDAQIYGYATILGDITQRRRSEDALRHSEARFRQLLEAIPQMVWSARPDLTFDYANRRWLDYTGMSQAQIAADGLQKLFDETQVEEIMSLWAEAAARRDSFSHEVRLRRRDGRLHWHLMRAIPILDADGHITEWFGTHTDIEEQKQVQSELIAARQEAEEVSQLKSAFLATVSHEIRTPLSAIIGFSLLLTEENWNEVKMREFAQIALRNGYALARIIDDILDLSKVEAGKLEVASTDLSIHELLSEVLESLSVKAKEKDILLGYHIDRKVPELIHTDAIRLRQIIVNIIGNAIKFTDQGEVHVSVGLEGPDQKTLGISIKDTGCGISPQSASNLFQAFVQADTSTSRRYGGTGLGLALSRKLAQLLGGNVLLQSSAPEEGSTFKIVVPVGEVGIPDRQAASAARGSFVRTASQTGRLKGRRILVAEDAVDTQLLIRQILQRQGAEVDFADNGQQAVDQALGKPYDIILMDIQMPVCDGYEATRRLRTSGYHRPIIGLSAHAMREEHEKILASGCNEHMAKPFEPRRLIDAIERLAGAESKPFNSRMDSQLPLG